MVLFFLFLDRFASCLWGYLHAVRSERSRVASIQTGFGMIGLIHQGLGKSILFTLMIAFFRKRKLK